MTDETPPSEHCYVGEWEKGETLGSGSFSVVWRANHRSTGQPAAIKEINLSRLNHKLRQSLESEVSILKRVSHPNCVRLIETVETDGKLFLVTEYCAGGDLAGLLRSRSKPLPESIVRKLMQDLAAGLRELHSQQLVHRDLKPQNLLLTTTALVSNDDEDEGDLGAASDQKPVLKVADFGFARALGPQLLAETLCGSPLYMAPEILQGHCYDAKADLFSVGAIFYEMLVGKPPYTGTNQVSLLRNIRLKEAKLPNEIVKTLSTDCVALVHALLKRNPVERCSFEDFFNHPWLSVGGGLGSGTASGTTGGTTGSYQQQLQQQHGRLDTSSPQQHIVGFRKDLMSTSRSCLAADSPRAAPEPSAPPLLASPAAVPVGRLSEQFKAPATTSTTNNSTKAPQSLPRLVSMRQPLSREQPPPLPSPPSSSPSPSPSPGGRSRLLGNLMPIFAYDRNNVQQQGHQDQDEVEEGFVFVTSPREQQQQPQQLQQKPSNITVRVAEQEASHSVVSSTTLQDQVPLTSTAAATETVPFQITTTTTAASPTTAANPLPSAPPHEAFLLDPHEGFTEFDKSTHNSNFQQDAASMAAQNSHHSAVAVPWQSASRREFFRLVARILISMADEVANNYTDDVNCLAMQLSYHLAALQLYDCVLAGGNCSAGAGGDDRQLEGEDADAAQITADNTQTSIKNSKTKGVAINANNDAETPSLLQSKEISQYRHHHQGPSRLHLSMQDSSFTSADSGSNVDIETIRCEVNVSLQRAQVVATAIAQLTTVCNTDDSSTTPTELLLPNAWQAAHLSALHWAEEAASEELLGNYDQSEQLYAKSSTVLHFLAAEAAGLPQDEGSNGPAVSAEDEVQLRRCAVSVAARWAVCVVALQQQIQR